MKAVQHIANYSSCESMQNEFLNLEQLLSISWVKSYSDDPNFHLFSLCKDEYGYSLMAEMNKGQDWWVVCDIIGNKKQIKELNIPKFKHK